jgi:hypothetical protein
MSFSVKISVSLPKKDLTKKKWLDAIASKQRAQSLPILRELFRKTVFGWSQKPDFSWSQAKTADAITLTIYPSGPGADKWTLVNQGSPAHDIYGKNQFLMSFKPGYRAATRPGSLQSSRAYRSGKTRQAQHIHHPGFVARNFTGLIVEAYASRYTSDMQAAITEVARR